MERVLFLSFKYWNKAKYFLFLSKFERFSPLKIKEEETLLRVIQNKSMLRITKILLSSISCQDIQPQFFLMCFLISSFPDYVDNEDTLVFLSKKVVSLFEGRELNKRRKKLRSYLLSVRHLLNSFKQREKKETLSQLSRDYINLIKSERLFSSLTFPEKEEILSFNTSHAQRIRDVAVEVYHTPILDFIHSSPELRQELEAASTATIEEELSLAIEKLEKEMKKEMKRAYWNKLEEDIALSNFDSLRCIIKEARTLLISLFSEDESKKIEIEDVVCPDLIINESIVADPGESIRKMSKYFFLLFKERFSEVNPSFVEETFLIFNIIDEILSQGNYSKSIPAALCLIFNRFEVINTFLIK